MPAARTGSDELTVGQLAERSGVAVSALHFYERNGLIRSVRTAGNQRRFARDTLRRVAFIRASQRVGIPLARIRQALDQLRRAVLAFPDEDVLVGTRLLGPGAFAAFDGLADIVPRPGHRASCE